MAKRRKPVRSAPRDPLTEPDAVVDDAQESAGEPDEREESLRDRELCGVAEINDALIELFDDIRSGFEDQAERSDRVLDFWDLFNCKLSSNQMYVGNSKVFVPIISNAVNARKVRFSNQIFPQTGRYVECISGADRPSDIISLMEHYVRRSKLRTQVTPPLMKNGDIEGQYNVYVSWRKSRRDVVFRTQRPLQVEGQPVPGTEDDDIETETITAGRPHVEVLADADVLILPVTADSVEDALEVGGSVTVIRRWTQAQIKKKIKDREIDAGAGKKLLDEFTNYDGDAQRTGEKKYKNMLDAAGIRVEDGRKFAQVYETWTMLTYDGERRIYRTFFGSPELILGCKRNPYWCDRVPVLSVPVEKVQGSSKGISRIKACADMQYAANDIVNEGFDSATYSMLPIIMTDPQKNPRVGSMVLNLAAIWETSPQDTQFAQFPKLWEDAFQVVNNCRNEIFQTLSVTPAMIPQSTSMNDTKNQAELATEAQIDILSTADVVTNLEEGIYTPLLQWFCDLDHQFRNRALTVREYGEMGVRANMQDIPPLQMDTRYEFRWFGVEAARNAQQIQQQIATVNVVRGIPEQMYAPYKFNMVPVISNLIDNAFGPRMAAEIFQDPRSQLSQSPELENSMLTDAFDIPVHPLDDDAQHIKVHQPLLQGGDPSGMIRIHIMKHLQQLSMKTQQQVQQTGQGMPGVPGGAGPGGPQPAPGVAGTPRIGAQPAGPRPNGQMPPGMIHHDRLQGAGIAPRR